MPNAVSQTPHLLIVDDDPIVTMLHKRISKKSGLHAEPQIFMNGKTALDYVLQHNSPNDWHLVLLDINMPVMDGWQMLEELSKTKLECQIKVVMATSSLDESDESRARKHERVIGYITKPVRKESLQELMSYAQLEDYVQLTQA